MKNLLVLCFLLVGFAIHADAQACKTPCPPQCCIAACCPAKGSAASASLLPAGTSATAACTPEQMAACTPEQIAACAKMSKKEMKACQKACEAKSKNACAAPAAAGTPATEKQVDRVYHTTPAPSKS